MNKHHGWYRVGITLGIAGLGLMALWLAMSHRVEAGVVTASQTTLQDFSGGEFLRTGLADVGDGAVSLLRAGLSGEWITTVVTAGLAPRWGHSAVYTAGRIYVLGGIASSTGMITGAALVQSATVRSDHDLTPWASVPTNLGAIFPKGIAYGGAVIVNGFMYVIGGQTEPSLDYGVITSMVAYAPIQPDGSLGAFTTTAPLPTGLAHMGVVAWDGWIYVLGGIDENLQPRDAIYAARPDPTTGRITSWQALSRTLPHPLFDHATVAEQGFIYAIGGVTDTPGTPLFEVWFAPLGDGTLQGPFTRTSSLDNNLMEMAAIGYHGLLLTSGGLQSNRQDVSQDVRAGVLADTGHVITWTATSLITPPRSAHAMVVLPDGWVYVIGGKGRENDQNVPLTHINAGRLGAEGAGLFVSNGRYLAPPFRLDRRRLMQALRLHVLRPEGTEIAVRYRTQPQEGFPWNDWSPWTSITGTGELTVSIPLEAYVQALQYELALTTTNPLTAPFLFNADLLYEVPDRPPTWRKEASPPDGTAVRPGDRLTYTMVLTNDSGATLHGLQLRDEFPAGTVYVEGSASASPGLSWTVSTSGVVAELATLGQGQAVRLTFAVTVTAGAGAVQNTAVLRTDEFGLQNSNSVVHPIATLTGTMGAAPPSGSIIFPGDRLTYTLRVTNASPVAVGPVEIAGQLPLSTTLVPGGIQATNGTVRTDAFPAFGWSLPSMDAGAAAILTVTVQVTEAQRIPEGAILTAAVALSGALPLPLGTLTHEVRQPYTIQVAKTDGRALVDIGEVVEYTITLTNTGWVTVTDLLIRDTLAGWPWIFFPDQPNAPSKTLILPALGPQAQAILTLSAQISLSANISDVVAPFTNTVTLHSEGTAGFPIGAPFTASDTTRLAGPDLIAAIPPGSVQYDGGVVTFTVVVTNVGVGTARPFSGTLGCALHWVLVGFVVNGNPYRSNYLGLPEHRLSPGASASQVFTLTVSPPAFLQAVVDAYAPGYGDPKWGCVVETDEGNNGSNRVGIGSNFQVFLPLVIRGP